MKFVSCLVGTHKKDGVYSGLKKLKSNSYRNKLKMNSADKIYR